MIFKQTDLSSSLDEIEVPAKSAGTKITLIFFNVCATELKFNHIMQIILPVLYCTVDFSASLALSFTGV